MSGWIAFALLAALILLLLWRPGRLDRSALMLVGAALFVAAAGYVWQGSPDERGAPAAGREKPMQPDTLFARERQEFLSKFGETGAILATADAFNRMGEDEAAAGLLRNAIRKRPKDVDLRIGYAHALFVIAQGNPTSAVNLAFDKAQAIAPQSPAPRYFRGLVQVEAGDLAGAERIWQSLYNSLPADSQWRAPLAKRLIAFEVIRAAQARQVAHPQ
jgi:cytochrome c-type biogenesis protein CcmH/NrfG